MRPNADLTLTVFWMFAFSQQNARSLAVLRCPPYTKQLNTFGRSVETQSSKLLGSWAIAY